MVTSRFRIPRVVLAAALLLAACGRQEAPPPQAPPERPRGTLHLYNWNNYIAPETIARFEQESGARVVQTYFTDNDEMLAKLAAGATGYDLIVPTGNAMEVLIRKGDLLPLDKSRLTRLANLDPALLDTPFDPGNRYSVPYAYSTTVIGYNDQAVKRLGLEPKGWEAIFDPALACRLKGRITVLDSPDEVFSAAFIYLGIDPNTRSLADYRRAADVIGTAKRCWAAFNSSSYSKELAAGNLWLALGYSTDLFQAALDAQAAGRDFRIVSVVPAQGAVLSVDHLVLHKSAPNPALAHAFIDFLLDGRNAAELSNLIGSGNANLAALPFIRPEVKASPAVFPDAGQRERLHQLRLLPPDLRQERGRLWTQIKVG